MNVTRRTALRSLAGSSLLLPGLLGELLAQDADPLAPRRPHVRPRASRVIFLFMGGGVSHVDSFDPKPRLTADAGKTINADGPVLKGPRTLLASPWTFRPGGRCGTEVSDLFPHVRDRMDDVAVIRSMKSDHVDHVQSTLGLHTGSVSFPRPSLGSWVSYGLGSVNRNLPSFLVVAPRLPYAGTQVYSNDFLPATHQGTRLLPGPEPIPNLRRRDGDAELEKLRLAFVDAGNRRHLEARGADAALSARIRSFETAFGMQQEASDAFDLGGETDATHRLYGLERGRTDGFAWACLAGRRLAERGVRFIELISGGADTAHNWDAHSGLRKGHAARAADVDRPIAGLLRDLKTRGMLDDTLVVWATEFGRTPYEDAPGDGRQHHAQAFSVWMAGGGVRGGIVHGKTDDVGSEIVEDACHVHDLHATVLHLLGLDHTKLTYRHAGRDYRLTDVHGHVVKELLA